jgi:glycosyltransferase involved in cell wall biosynthesis
VDANQYIFQPRLSLVVPCYNEEACLRETACELIEAFTARGIPLQLVLVDNGSLDRTGQIIDQLVAQGLPVTKVCVAANCGYGHGILEGLKRCTAPLVGYLCADGQVSSGAAVEAYRLACEAGAPILVKVRRRIRKDSWRRKLVSACYNFGMPLFFGWLGTIDLNASPKILPREYAQAMALQSKDWFLDPELMIKSRHLGLGVTEFDVPGELRRGGKSNVRLSTCWEFAKNIWRFRFGGGLRQWMESVEPHEVFAETHRPVKIVDGDVPK